MLRGILCCEFKHKYLNLKCNGTYIVLKTLTRYYTVKFLKVEVLVEIFLVLSFLWQMFNDDSLKLYTIYYINSLIKSVKFFKIVKHTNTQICTIIYLEFFDRFSQSVF